MLNGLIIRALDVGYGNVKLVTGHEALEKPVICEMFPSRSPAASEDAIGEGALKQRDTVVVTIAGTSYEVGRDVADAQGANDISSILDNNFVREDGYMARVIGAFHYMFKTIEEDYIDVLVVGLPVANMKSQKEFLIKKLSGYHVLPTGRKIQIKSVRVIEQPLGAFFNFVYSAVEPNKESFKGALRQNNLIIDPGMYTFDWLVINSLRPSPQRSGGTSRAMSDVMKAMGKVIANKVNTTEAQAFKMIDNAIRKGVNPRFFNEEVDLEEYIKHAKPIINQSVDAMANSVGDGADIDNIMLVGGGARFFVDAIQAKFPRHKIITTDNSVYANVIGFQLFGEKQYLADQVQKRKTSLQGDQSVAGVNA